ncbi:TetR/AcrR family transcriptional regulator [Nocardioides mangrovi]|uniref:TetR/AcrR family transcriptional regulator n=1 Tax=Nocardioides mangrovi TaxID=2874580 RepID=A0ABS7UIK4_9ACTN|nr:TetR/AcrR family transcriptional regulator [Nocardioides mangrovi]MBZ5740873.1 TetR/AcrR family transcriptional regulator [Nocardioides mangrovi]
MTGRRRPVQARSREMVDRILEAATRVLATRGYAGMSTNRVATEAGVSVGSLYRYFGDKDEIIAELRTRCTADVMADLTEAMSRAVSLPTRDAVHRVLTTLVGSLQRHRALMTALVDEVPLGAQGNVLPEVERQLAHFTRMFVATHAPHLEPAEADARIYLAMGVALSTCLRIALDPPPGISEDHLVDLTADLLGLGLVLGG